MTTPAFVNTCTVCGAEESLDALLHRMIDDDTVRRLIAQVVNDSLPLGALVVRYLRLHKPARQRLRMKIVAQLLAELVPDMQRGRIERSGRSWVCDGDGWKAALQAVFDAQDKGTLGLPLQGNGYLYQVLMRMADKDEAAVEKQNHDARRARTAAPSSGTAAPPVADVLASAAVPGVSVPAPAQPPAGPKVDSPTVRAFKAQLAAKKAVPHD